MDYLGLLGSEDRARRFSEEVLDRLATFLAKMLTMIMIMCVSQILSFEHKAMS